MQLSERTHGDPGKALEVWNPKEVREMSKQVGHRHSRPPGEAIRIRSVPTALTCLLGKLKYISLLPGRSWKAWEIW